MHQKLITARKTENTTPTQFQIRKPKGANNVLLIGFLLTYCIVFLIVYLIIKKPIFMEVRQRALKKSNEEGL